VLRVTHAAAAFTLCTNAYASIMSVCSLSGFARPGRRARRLWRVVCEAYATRFGVQVLSYFQIKKSFGGPATCEEVPAVEVYHVRGGARSRAQP
jgi:hypothetical protein